MPKIDIKRVAKLANLPLSSDEEKLYQKQLEETLEYVYKLEGVDTKGVDSTSQVTGLENVLRKDEAKPSLSQKDVLKNTKSSYNGFFKVKAILENQ